MGTLDQINQDIQFILLQMKRNKQVQEAQSKNHEYSIQHLNQMMKSFNPKQFELGLNKNNKSANSFT